MSQQSLHPQVTVNSNDPIIIQNALFRGIPKYSSWNACVGNNGNPDIYYYAEGFSEATIKLIESLFENNMAHLDTLIYPICFNLRHSVELYIKGFIEALKKLAEIKNVKLISHPDCENKNVMKMHDIGQLWKYLTFNSERLDSRYKEYTDKLSPLIDCINEVDPTGQTFRYSYDMDTRKKHLVPVSVINVLNLKVQFNKIRGLLEDLDLLNDFLIAEYGTGTFTKNLSRHDIENIAKRLPPYEKWGDDSFVEMKANIKAEFGIGSKELSSAIDFIRKNYDFCKYIGIERPMLGVKEDELFSFIDLLCDVHDIDELRNNLINQKNNKDSFIERAMTSVGHSDFNLEEMFKDFERSDSAVEKLCSEFTPDVVAGILTLTEFGCESFSEIYVRMYFDRLEQYEVIHKVSDESWRQEMGLMWIECFGNSYYLKKIIESLNCLNMTEMARKVESYCHLDGLVLES